MSRADGPRGLNAMRRAVVFLACLGVVQASLRFEGEMETMVTGHNNWEYKLLEAGDWELEHLHDVLTDLRGSGWQLDTAYSGAEHQSGELGLHLWLKRPRSTVRRAS